MTFQEIHDAAQAKINSVEKKSHQRLLHGVAKLMKALEEKEVDASQLSEELSALNEAISEKTNIGQIRSHYNCILKKVRETYGYINPGYYQTQWMAIGMAAFGLPMGVAFALAIGNMAFMGIGLPIGMPIGMAIGLSKDKKAKDEGKMLTL